MFRPGGVFALTLTILLVGLIPMAYADPPDATWIGGFWDDDDYDSVVDFITNASAISALPVTDEESLWISDEWVRPGQPSARSAAHRTLACPRAPPTIVSADS